MAEYPVFTKQDLADFSGRHVNSYKQYAELSALPQATLLFKIATCRPTYPSDPEEALLARMAILAMADRASLAQKYQEAEASPFQSESLGSYSYSKMSAAASRGEKTGVMWFDLAVDRLGQCEQNDGIAGGGGIEIFEYDGRFGKPQAEGDQARLLGPADFNAHQGFLSEPHDPNGLTRN